MKSLIRVHNLNNNKDVQNIRKIIAINEGIIACEISLGKKEVQIVYDHLSISLDEIVTSIEMSGYMIY